MPDTPRPTLRKGTRVHGYSGGLVNTRTAGTLLDTPGTMNAFVQWDGYSSYGLEPLHLLVRATEPCPLCGGRARHRTGCAVYAGLAHLHPYAAGSVTFPGQPTPCRHCGRDESFTSLHGTRRGPDPHDCDPHCPCPVGRRAAATVRRTR